MIEIERENIIKLYQKRYGSYGYSPKSLLWDKGKQDIRFDILTSFYNLKYKSILDIGCGFGDLNRILYRKFGDYNYLGIDLVEDLINKAKELYARPNIKFITGEFLEYDFFQKFDYIIASGIFNYKMKHVNNYTYIESIINKAMEITIDGVAFDFLSDKVDYKYEDTFHSSPEKILNIAYKYSRNIILRNDYMPFEFSVFIFKDDSFAKEDTLFSRYKILKGMEDK